MIPEQNDDWWLAAFRFAVLQAGLAPSEFWRLSLPELSALTALPGGQDIPGRNDLESLMRAHPDLPNANPKPQER